MSTAIYDATGLDINNSSASNGRPPSRTLVRSKRAGKLRGPSRDFGGSAVRLQELFMENLKRGSPSPPLADGPRGDLDAEDLLSPSLTLNKDGFESEWVDLGQTESCANSHEGWSKVSKVLRDYDDNKIKVVKEDIDTLLVFAGLFSAVLTAFVVESYEKLEEGPEDVSARLLLQISQQITSFAITPSFMNATNPVASPPAFEPTAAMVRINALWFSALTLSLFTASLGILVKQWLHEYMSHDSLSPRAHVRIRQFRYEGLVRWHVFEIAATLPLLVQISLLLFFLGLSDFLRLLNPVIGWSVTTLILFWAAIFIMTTFASAFSSQCPYKSRIFKSVLQKMRPALYVTLNCLLYGLIRAFQPSWCIVRSVHSRSISIGNASKITGLMQEYAKNVIRSISKWYHASVVYLVDISTSREEKEVRGDTSFDMPYLASADALFLDDDFLEPVGECLMDVDLADALPCIRQIVSYRCDLPLRTLEDLPLHWSTMGQMTRAGTLCLQRNMIDLINQEVDRVLSFHGEFIPSEWTTDIAEAVFFVVAADFLFMEQENARELFSRLLGLNVVTAQGVLEALCKHPSYNPAPQVPYTEYMPNVLDAARLLLDRNGGQEMEEVSPECDDSSILSMHSSDRPPLEPVKLCMIFLSLVDQAPMSDIWTHGESFLELQSVFAAIVSEDLEEDKPMPWAPRTPTWSMNILRYLQHHIPEFVDERLIEVLDAAAEKQEQLSRRIA